MNQLLGPSRLRRSFRGSGFRFLAAAGWIAASVTVSHLAVAAAPESVTALRAKLAQQVGNYSEMETLRATHADPKRQTGERDSHELLIRLQGSIQVVSEEHNVDGVVLGKDYFLDGGEVYALRVWHRVPAPDGATARITESRVFFENGKPIYRGGVTTRVPLSMREPDLSKMKDTEVPLPPGIDGWGAQLKSRAFAIARSFRPHVGQYVFGEWDSYLLKNAPAEDPGLIAPARPEGWLPPKETRVLPIRDTESPDGLFKVGWGYKEGPVDWEKLADEPNYGDRTFSTKLAQGELKPPLSEDSNFLMNAVTNEPVSDLGLYHPGERQRFNHDEILLHWSPSSTCFIVEETGKWGNDGIGVGWIKAGKCAGTFDIAAPLSSVAESAVKKSSHPAAKRLKQEGDGFSFGIGKVLVEDDGRFEIRVYGQVPKDDAASGNYDAIVTGTFLPGSGESPAVIKNAKVKVLPPDTE